jgi:hypothetical protein
MTGYLWSTLLPMLPDQDRRYLADALLVDERDLGPVLADGARIAAAIESLDTDARQLLARLWLSGGQMSPDQLFRQGASNALGVFAALARKGLVVQLRLDYYHQVYALPLDANEAVFRAVVMPHLPVDWQHVRELRDPLAPAMPVWARDLFRTMSYCRWNTASLTQQGEIYKRVKQQIALTLWPDHARDPLERLDYLVKFGTWSRLLRLDVLRGTIRPTEEAEAFWEAPPSERWDLYLDYWVEMMVPAMQLGAVVWDLLVIAGPVGYAPDALAHVLARSGLVGQGRARSIIDQVADFGGRAGLVERTRDRVGLTAEARGAIRGHFEEEGEPSGVIEATGDILIQAESPPGPLFQAEAVMALHRADVSWTYRFDRVALERAVSLGIEASEARRRVLAVSRTDLPQNIDAEMEDAFRQAGRVRVVTGTVIFARDPRAEAQANELLAGLDLTPIRPGVWLAERDTGQEAAQRLYRRGLALRATVDQHGSRDRYGLLDPGEPDRPYHPQVAVSVPRSAPVASSESPRAFLEGAARSGMAVTMQYQTDSRTVQVMRARGIQIINGFVLGLDTYTDAPLMLELSKVIRVWQDQ